MKKQEIKVRLHHRESGDYLEVWESMKSEDGNIQYFGRDDSFKGSWSYLADAPYGYCEKSYYVATNVEFICCDNNWNEVLRDGNGLYPGFLSLESTARNHYANINDDFKKSIKLGFKKWIMDKMPEDVTYHQRINWGSFLQEEVSRKTMSSFNYFNEQYDVLEVQVKHTVCDATWKEYFTAKAGAAKNENFLMFHGCSFE